MKLTKSKLQQIIKEELNSFLENEAGYNDEQSAAQEWLNTQDMARVRGNDSEGYMRLVSLLTTDSEKYRRELGFPAVEDGEAREMIDTKLESDREERDERSRKWKEENPDTSTPEERQAASKRSMAAAHAEDPTGFTFGT